MRTEIKMIAFASIMALAACKANMKTPAYLAFVKSAASGLCKTVEVDGFEYCMQYKPYDYIVLLENHGEPAESPNSRKKQLSGTAWFNISIKRGDNQITPLRYGISSPEEYQNRLSYYLNDAKKDIWLVYGADTLRPVSYLFENNYNLTPQETMVVGFYLPQGENYPRKKMQLAFADEAFKNGIIRATYSEKSLNDIPNLVN